MNTKLLYAPIIALIFSACTASDRQEPENQAADIIFRSGHVYTVDARRSWAQVYAFVGDREQTIQAPGIAFEQRLGSRSVLSMKINPVYDFLRDDPRFIALLAKVGLLD